MYDITNIGLSEHLKRYEKAENYKFDGGTENENK